MSKLEDARCVGQHHLFDSTDLNDHAEARQLCAECPAAQACRQILDTESTSYAWAGTGPVGTWAGVLVGSTNKHRFVALPRECGTDRGYYQHNHRGERACKACLNAHAAAARQVAS